ARLPPCTSRRSNRGRPRGIRGRARGGRGVRAVAPFRSVIGIGPADPRYPRRLLDLRCAPDPLWIDGDADALAGPTVSIVGTRRMTPYGDRVARELASACAEAGILVVSGLAQ